MNKQRNSSVELYRILATFLVIIVHLNGWLAGGMPESFDITHVSLKLVGQNLIESYSSVCVNCFLIISGYYGLKLKMRSIWNIYVLLICIYIPFCILNFVLIDSFSLKEFISASLVFSKESYFVQCYLMLMFLSPILNTFIDTYGRRVLKYIILFFLIECYFHCIRGNESLGFNHGYSVLHFVLIYLMARLLYLYRSEVMTVNSWYWILGYIAGGLLISLMYINHIKWAFDYSNPINILSSFCLFIPFLYKKYVSYKINWIASSTFAVYIMHTYSPFVEALREIDNYFLNEYSYSFYLMMMVVIAILVFVICIIYDKIRIRILSPITDYIYEKLNNKFFKSNTLF